MHTIYQFDKARESLTHWTIKRAARIAKDIGFSYEPADDAPNTFESLKTEYAQCMRQRRGLRVYSGASDKTIYTMPEGNYAFRFIHDVYHVAFNLGFSTEDEMKTAQRHIDEVSQAFGPDSLETRMITADTQGQARHYAEFGQHIDNQLAFAHGYCGIS